MKTKHPIFFLAIFSLFTLIFTRSLTAQVSINTDGSPPPPSAMLEVKSTTKGLLIPRMNTSQIMMISNPVDGLQVYNTEWGKLYVYVASAGLWKEISYGSGTILQANPNFNCGDLLNDLRDGGKIYETVQIGTQCWMKQNLNVGLKIDGTLDQQNNNILEKYCYNNDEANCDVYGGLYQWNEMMNYAPSSNTNPSGVQGICPPGWHLPSDAEWCQMETFLDASVECSSVGNWIGTDIGGKMKETGTTHWADPNSGATNSSGFTALPSGYRHPSGNLFGINTETAFWSSTQSTSEFALNNYLIYNNAQIALSSDSKIHGFSVRCIKN